MIRMHLQQHFSIDEDHISVRRTRPDDFIVRFTNQLDLDAVLSTPSPPRAPFILRWWRWSRLIMGSVGAFRYRVLVGMKGIPSHARSLEVIQVILISIGAKAEITNLEALDDLNNETELFVTAWCAYPDLIPDEKIMAVLEEEEEHDKGSSLYLRTHEIIHDEVSALRYLVRPRTMEFQDWHTPPPSSDEDYGYNNDEDSSDSNYSGFHPRFGDSGGTGARPRKTRIAGPDKPRLGHRSGPTFLGSGSEAGCRSGRLLLPDHFAVQRHAL
ncbi:unnamed protein product [Miscanthus lutarioriparius]|uniref:Uncharacterized protein n=1 Tax=Miscanthus lutarioriparius TaxID=422564 RepID=A0A811NU29_9POAL|nr:unnamed protein product [Miscanthus lutarioriparius]